MGLFCANVHFRDVDENALRTAISQRGLDRYRLLSAKGGWTSLYEERASEQDDEWIRELAGELTRDLGATAIAFMVHDSDIACYWLLDNGQLIDEYNSFPDYFDMGSPGGEPSGPRGGRAEILLPYCRKGVKQEELTTILSQQPTFAESIIEQLAGALGIDPGRALADYRHGDDGEDDGPGGFGGFGGDDEDGDDDDDRGGPRVNLAALRDGLTGQLAQMFNPRTASADPQAAALVAAAAAGDTIEIDRLLSSGVAVDAEAPPPPPAGQPLAGLGQLFPGGGPRHVMTPLLTALVHRQARAAEVLLEHGADPNRVHPLFGTPIHSTAAAGDTEMLQLIIDRGGDVNARNIQGQTALQILAASRSSLDRLAQAQAMMKSLGPQVAGIFDQLSKLSLPTEGWDRCEQILKAHGAR
ncbi:MAG TPA: ankyrin repeat domain-containing protein [Pirellulales bacterium]|nr:ankyrin repeat domain-containing protein [Pirellulales bacterium]